MIKAVIFDFDGTIADSFDVALEVGLQLLHEQGYDIDLTKEEVRGSTLEMLRSKYHISWFKALRILPRARKIVSARADEIVPVRGVVQAVNAVQRSCKVAVGAAAVAWLKPFLRGTASRVSVSLRVCRSPARRVGSGGLREL